MDVDRRWMIGDDGNDNDDYGNDIDNDGNENDNDRRLKLTDKCLVD